MSVISLSAARKATFRPANRDDRAFLIPELARTFPATPLEDWTRLFDYPWLEDKPDLGTVAELHGQPVAFAGALYSHRLIGGRMRRVCCTSSYWVAEPWRGVGIGRWLVDAYLDARPDDIVLFLTIQPKHRKFWTRYKVRPMEEYWRIFSLPPRPSSFLSSLALRRIPDADVREDMLGEHDFRIFRDHLPLRCMASVWEVRGEPLLVVSRRRTVDVDRPTWAGRLATRLDGREADGVALGTASPGVKDRVADQLRGRLPAVEIVYTSRPSLVPAVAAPLGVALCRAHRGTALLADPRRLGLPVSERGRLPGLYTFLGTDVEGIDVDVLYSEFLVMPM